MYEKLKPCPWCKDNIALGIAQTPCECGYYDWIYVECIRCGATGPHVILEPDDDRPEAAAIKRWNEMGESND